MFSGGFREITVINSLRFSLIVLISAVLNACKAGGTFTFFAKLFFYQRCSKPFSSVRRSLADYIYVASLRKSKQVCFSLSFRNFQYVFISILILFPRLVREWGTRGAHARNAIIIVLVLRCIMHIYYIDSRMSMNSWRVIPRSRMALRTTNSGIGSTCV